MIRLESEKSSSLGWEPKWLYKDFVQRSKVHAFHAQKLGLSGWRDSVVGRVFELHAANLGSNPDIPYNPLRLPGIMSECRTRSNP